MSSRRRVEAGRRTSTVGRSNRGRGTWHLEQRDVRRLEIQRVVIAPHTSAGGDALDLMRTFGATGARVSVIPALLQVVGSAVELDDVQVVAVLGVRSFSLPRSSRMVKRMFDVLSASLGLALTAPLIAVPALLVKLTSRGPVFFRQERVARRSPL
jgi:Bacterial sugar transferase